MRKVNASSQEVAGLDAKTVLARRAWLGHGAPFSTRPNGTPNHLTALGGRRRQWRGAYPSRPPAVSGVAASM
eukprot:11198987-Lingulodinium_polyedra.AAC.1